MQITNPFTQKPCSDELAEFVTKVREVRRNARKAARSGNPAVSGPARKVLAQVGPTLAAGYMREVGR